MNPPTPPPPAALALPLLPPLQFTFPVLLVLAVTAEPGCVTLTVDTALHPLASVIVTVYVFAGTFEIFCVIALLLHAYVYAPVPPAPAEVALPVLAPKQFTFPPVLAVAVGPPAVFTVVDAVFVQPFASVIVTVYGPAPNPVAVCAVLVLLHK